MKNRALDDGGLGSPRRQCSGSCLRPAGPRSLNLITVKPISRCFRKSEYLVRVLKAKRGKRKQKKIPSSVIEGIIIRR